MTANKAAKPSDYVAQEPDTKLSAVGHPGDEMVIGIVDPEKIAPSGFGLAEFGLSAEPDHSGLTTMGRFLADGGIGRMEELIRSSVSAQPPPTKEKAGERSSNMKKTSSVVVEVGSVYSLDANRIVRDFGKK